MATRDVIFHRAAAVTLAFWLFFLLVLASPILALLPEQAVQGAVAIYLAVTLLVVGLRMRPGEATHAAQVMRPFLLVAVVPGVWMLVQVLPAAIGENQMWAMARAALGQGVIGSISVDVGSTTRSLAGYAIGLGLVVAGMAVALDRKRAEWLLAGMSGVTTAMAATIVFHDLTGAVFLGELRGPTRALFDSGAALGLVLAAVCADLVIERYETRHQRGGMTVARLIEGFSAALVALAVCAFAVFNFHSGSLAFAAAAGCTTFAVIVGTRRFGRMPWLNLGLAAAVVAGFAMVVASQWTTRETDVAIRFATSHPPSATVQRMLAETPSTGFGAGSYGAIASIYRAADDTGQPPPTTAAVMVVELGRPALWIAVGLALVLAGLLVRGALTRGRDSFYAAGAAGCTIVLALLAFRDASLLQPTSAILAGAIIGLGIAQSVGRSARSAPG